jgi:hypothetical protein
MDFRFLLEFGCDGAANGTSFELFSNGGAKSDSGIGCSNSSTSASGEILHAGEVCERAHQLLKGTTIRGVF